MPEPLGRDRGRTSPVFQFLPFSRNRGWGRSKPSMCCVSCRVLPEEGHPKAGMSQHPDSLELPREAQGTGQAQLLSYPGPTRSTYS